MLVNASSYIAGKKIDSFENAPENGFSWIGLLHPTELEVLELCNRYPLDSFAVEDAIKGGQRPKIDVYEYHNFACIKTASYDQNSATIRMGEVLIFVSESFIVTVRHGEYNSLEKIRAEVDSNPSVAALGTSNILYSIFDSIVDSYFEIARHLREKIELLEEKLLEDDKPSPTNDFYRVKRELLEFRRAILPLQDPLTRLIAGEISHVSSPQSFLDVLDHVSRIADEIQILSDLLDAALQANFVRIQLQQNSDTRKISALAAIALIPTLLIAIYSINFEYLDKFGNQKPYYLLGFSTIVLVAILSRNFRNRKWL